MKSQMPRKRVAITGVGAVTPLGHDFSSTWNQIRSGKPATGSITRFEADHMPTQIACEVKSYNLKTPELSEVDRNGLSYIGEFAYGAAREALSQAGLFEDDQIPATEKACILGIRGATPSFQWYEKNYLPSCYSDESARTVLACNPNETMRVIAGSFNAKGGNTAVQTACASSGQSLGEAFEMVANGERTVVLSGGADSMVEPFSIAGFNLLGALSTRNDLEKGASRPFDLDRNGFVLGEGACMLVFEEWDHAVARNAIIIGEISGYGATESAYRITDLHPEGQGPIEAMQNALQTAGITASDIDYINAHGTSTFLNDAVESLSIKKVFSSHKPLVSSTKSMSGHLIAAAGALEFAVCIQALEEQTLPPSINCVDQDPVCEIALTPSEATPAKLNYALSNSIGFGGSNSALIAKRVIR